MHVHNAFFENSHLRLIRSEYAFLKYEILDLKNEKNERVLRFDIQYLPLNNAYKNSL